MVIQHNINSMFTQRQLNIVDDSRADSSEKLSTGYRINRAADDAAGLSISEKLRYQIRGLNKASNNIAEGISLVKVADGALNESHAILQRMNELAVQAANDTNTSLDRGMIQFEIDDLVVELDRIANTTAFNEHIYPLTGTATQTGSTLPNSITVATVSILNDSNTDFEYNGKIYHPGETMQIDNVLWYTEGSKYGGRISFATYDSATGVGDGFFPYSHIFTPIRQNPSKVTEIFKNTFISQSDTYVLHRNTPDDLQVDANGYYYFIDSNSSSSQPFRYYFTKDGVDNIYDAQGLPIPNPTIADLEAAGCLKRNTGGNNNPGSSSTPDLIKIQAGHHAGQSIDIPLVDATVDGLGVGNLDVMTHTYASNALPVIQAAINKVSSYRSTFGSCQNRLEHAMRNVDNTAENSQAAESRIRDTNMAEEMMKLSTANIISQAANSMLAQANQMPSSILRLLE